MKFSRAMVVTGNGSDTVILETDLPEPTWPYKGKLSVSFNAAQHTGMMYVREHFGLEAEVIETTKR